MPPSLPVVLQVNRFPAETEQRLRDTFRVEWLPEVGEPRERLISERAGEIRGIATASLGPVTADLMARLPKLEIVACFSSGVDGIDTAYAAKHGIPVTNSGAAIAGDVADLALALILTVGRGLREADTFVRNGQWSVQKGQWSNGNYPIGHAFRGRKIGLIGFGRIGQAIARRLSGFDVTVGYTARSVHADTALPWFPTPVALAEWSDILVACCPGGPATRGLVNREVLAALGSSGILINVSRGSVVDEPALVEALANGVIGGAGLDVFAQEPRVPPEILAHPRVVLLPHIGTATEESRRAMGDSMIDALIARLIP